jgi:DNA polymerase I
MEQSETLKAGDHLYLVDGSGYIFRAYHALPPLTRKSDGLPVGAISGFCNMLVKLRDELGSADGPTHLAVIFDPSGPNFRHELYPEYKANRGETPEDLIPQFPIVRDAVRAFDIPSVELPGFEADDLIASYAVAARDLGARVTIVSSDKDLMQLVDPLIDMLDTMKDRKIGPDEVFEKFGVPPNLVIDVQSLAGDSVDNVPGVPGIGIKTAALLIQEYGGLDQLLERASEIKQTKRRENLIEFADQARISRDLVTLKQDTELPCGWEDMRLTVPQPEPLIGFLKAMEFNSLTKRMAARLDVEPDDIDAHPDLRAGGATALQPNTSSATTSNTGSAAGAAVSNGADGAGNLAGAGGAFFPKPNFPPIDVASYACITSMEELQVWIDEATASGILAIDTETTGLDAMQCDLVGISLATQPGRAAYIPLAHGKDGLDLGQEIMQLPMDDVLTALKPILCSPDVLKILQNAKYDFQVLRRYGVTIAPFDDTMLLSYAADAGLHGHGMDELSQLWLEHKTISIKDLIGKGKNKIRFDQVQIAEAAPYAAEDADITLRLWHALKPRLVEQKVTSVYETTERPLVPVLVDMESRGILVDRQILSRLSGEFSQKMGAIEAEVYELAGEHFNIASPKQLGEIMFERMGLPGGKKTKTGAYATGADILEGLAAEGHELPAKVLEWRGMAKLKSTYTDALPEFINPQTNRIHTSYSLASTTTGRLSSSDPNLQNIPIRSEAGRRIRTAFVAQTGNCLVSADYSQIELRILAHIADIPELKKAFADGEDIHARTASEIFGVPLKDMTSEIRRRAKAINFGIIYGISAFGLANQLSISRGEAASYIEAYFKKFPGIRDYMDAIKLEAHAQGYVTTLFGRKIHFKDIQAKQPALRAFAERAAINAPIQGSAADIIRRAMIKMPDALAQSRHTRSAQMLLQVHDELIFEVAEAEADALITLVRGVMENACAPRLDLSVPLIVDARAAANWDEAH